MIYEFIGYIASAVVALSLMMSSIIRLRWLNLAGALVFMFYGWVIRSYPVVFLNGFIVVADIYYLVKLYTFREYFRVVEFDRKFKYFHLFMKFYRDDIRKVMPGFKLPDTDALKGMFVLRNMVPAGVFLYEEQKPGTIVIHLDYAIPDFRDFKIGRYLFHHQRDHFMEKNIHRMISCPGNRAHEKYLRKMGFQLIRRENDRCTYGYEFVL